MKEVSPLFVRFVHKKMILCVLILQYWAAFCSYSIALQTHTTSESATIGEETSPLERADGQKEKPSYQSKKDVTNKNILVLSNKKDLKKPKNTESILDTFPLPPPPAKYYKFQ
ncbi:conserved hypothetical protein [Candidatus Liberibacter solanacearum]|uniref:hypothetical protein n=1 Tax=Candidatus Liberibacter solanacearum TaxID=556287 RepID=UPI0038727BEC